MSPGEAVGEEVNVDVQSLGPRVDVRRSGTIKAAGFESYQGLEMRRE